MWSPSAARCCATRRRHCTATCKASALRPRLRLAAALDRSLPVLWPAARAGTGDRLGVGPRARLLGAVRLPCAALSRGGRPVRAHGRDAARDDARGRVAHRAADAACWWCCCASPSSASPPCPSSWSALFCAGTVRQGRDAGVARPAGHRRAFRRAAAATRRLAVLVGGVIVLVLYLVPFSASSSTSCWVCSGSVPWSYTLVLQRAGLAGGPA